MLSYPNGTRVKKFQRCTKQIERLKLTTLPRVPISAELVSSLVSAPSDSIQGFLCLKQTLKALRAFQV